jgi:hypothetical protein
VFHCPASPGFPASKKQVFALQEEPATQQSAKPWQKPPCGEQHWLAALHCPVQH